MQKSSLKLFYMTCTFNLEVSLHFWFLWPTVWQTGSRAGWQALQAVEGRDDQVGSKNVVEGG